ncbi:hypothetical protein BU17DRAFT_60085 [Hysterangium stoloniferum]|nr:hypothetical protein BU17DRAFT_60085 [Hysterangium stoloniferum]
MSMLRNINTTNSQLTSGHGPSNTLDSWISHSPNTSSSSRWNATADYGSFPQGTRMHSDESHSSQWDPSPDPMVLLSGRGYRPTCFQWGYRGLNAIRACPHILHLVDGIAATARPSDSSSICMNPWSKTAAAPDFTQTGHSVRKCQENRYQTGHRGSLGLTGRIRMDYFIHC